MTRGWLLQRAELPGLNGGGAAAAVHPKTTKKHIKTKYNAKRK